MEREMEIVTNIRCWYSDTCQPDFYNPSTPDYVLAGIDNTTTYDDLLRGLNQQALAVLPEDWDGKMIQDAIQDMFSEVVDMFEIFDETLEDETYVHISFKAE
jgi:hypothetical protein